MTTDYLSGGMTGHPEFQFPLFDSVRDADELPGNTVISPADHDRAVLAESGVTDLHTVPGFDDGNLEWYGQAFEGMATEALFAWDFRQVMDADRIVMLPGWEKSTGARYERIVAEACGKEVVLAIPHCNEGDPIQDAYAWSFVHDEDQKCLTNYLKHYGVLAPQAALEAVPPRLLLAEIRRRYPQVQFKEPLDKIEAQLA